MSGDFVHVSSLHSHSTRSSRAENFFISPVIAQMPSGFVSTAIKAWNELPLDIKLVKSELPFKQKLKAYLLSKYL